MPFESVIFLEKNNMENMVDIEYDCNVVQRLRAKLIESLRLPRLKNYGDAGAVCATCATFSKKIYNLSTAKVVHNS